MIPEAESPWLRMRDLAREQKAALEEGRLDDAETLAGRRNRLFLEIQKNDGLPGVKKPAAPESVVREILAIDGEAAAAVQAGMRDVSREIEKINTFKVLCKGVVDGALHRGNPPVP